MSDAVLKVAAALANVGGKTIDRVFLARHSEQRYQLLFVFTDATYYEFYGVGHITGARTIDRGDASCVRAILGNSDAEVVEIGATAG